ncbi:hypothetical protein C8R44DRAFT_740492 [Mycena epipterygia]|nr:hypothetical protein C8R44DRAFT_740492 [Mycena epipterygia]
MVIGLWVSARRRATISESDKENDTDTEPKPKRRRNQLTEIVKSRNAADAKRLEHARKVDEDRHAEIVALQQRSINLQENLVTGIGQLSSGLAALANAQAKLTEFEYKRSEEDNRLRYEDLERRRTDAERRATEAERHASLLNALSRTNKTGSSDEILCEGGRLLGSDTSSFVRCKDMRRNIVCQITIHKKCASIGCPKMLVQNLRDTALVEDGFVVSPSFHGTVNMDDNPVWGEDGVIFQTVHTFPTVVKYALITHGTGVFT